MFVAHLRTCTFFFLASKAHIIWNISLLFFEERIWEIPDAPDGASRISGYFLLRINPFYFFSPLMIDFTFFFLSLDGRLRDDLAAILPSTIISISARMSRGVTDCRANLRKRDFSVEDLHSNDADWTCMRVSLSFFLSPVKVREAREEPSSLSPATDPG